MAKENKKLVSLLEEWQESVWYDFHGGNINDKEGFEENYNEFINARTIYKNDCEEILENNLEYLLHRSVHTIPQGAIEVLYDYFAGNANADKIWSEMEEVLNED